MPYARVRKLTDVLSLPEDPASPIERDRRRETQACPNTSVRVLSDANGFSKVETADGVHGWIVSSDLEIDAGLTGFADFQAPLLSMAEFLKVFEGTPYLPGGLSPGGLDCSGLIQLYFLRVRGRIVPRNSRQQRALAKERPFSTAQAGDLVFALEKENGRHHVGLLVESSLGHAAIFHTDSREGVVRHTPARFEELYLIEAVITVD